MLFDLPWWRTVASPTLFPTPANHILHPISHTAYILIHALNHGQLRKYFKWLQFWGDWALFQELLGVLR